VIARFEGNGSGQAGGKEFERLSRDRRKEPKKASPVSLVRMEKSGSSQDPFGKEVWAGPSLLRPKNFSSSLREKKICLENASPPKTLCLREALKYMPLRETGRRKRDRGGCNLSPKKESQKSPRQRSLTPEGKKKKDISNGRGRNVASTKVSILQ